METEKKKLTDTQLRVFMAIGGLICAAALMVSISLSQILTGLLQYLFVAIFIVITLGRRWIETKYRIRLNFFNLVLINGIMFGILIYVIIIFSNPTIVTGIPDIWEILIIVGITLLILVLGIGLPLRLYFKRKEKGTLVPIRVPEPTEEEEKAAESKNNYARGGQSSIAQQIAEMEKELERKDEENK